MSEADRAWRHAHRQKWELLGTIAVALICALDIWRSHSLTALWEFAGAVLLWRVAMWGDAWLRYRALDAHRLDSRSD